ncbi:MAG: hypothetical protein KatS3mg095_0012 [Candidatus Parcubacteria bacterium]|nr:MAG: hypothetical protein KatS3mg095_0012 [Candidatus Parcubacteria bacterium]
MIKNAQLLVEVLIGILILSFLSLIIFFIFNIIPQSIKNSDEVIIIYNSSLNYENIILGLSRKNYSQFENLLNNQPYYINNNYEIKLGKEKYLNDYYRWFEKNEDKINVYIQSLNNIYIFPLKIANIKEKIFFQDKWETATDSVIDLTTVSNINQYNSKSENIQTNGQIQLSQ